MENDHKGGNKTKLKASDIYSDDSGSSDSAEEEEEVAKSASQRRSSSSESRDSDSDNDKKSVICLFYAQIKSYILSSGIIFTFNIIIFQIDYK